MADQYDGITIGDKLSEIELEKANKFIYNKSLIAVPTGETAADGSLEYELQSASGLKVVNLDGEITSVSQGFGLGTREHDQVRLSYGDTRITSNELVMGVGDFMIIRLNVREPEELQHHVENREVTSGEGSLRFRVYDVTGNENLFPANPNRMQIVNQNGPFIEDPADVQAEFFSYPIQSSDPFAGEGLPRFNNIPLLVSPGGFLQADGSDVFADDRGRHYTANRVYAVVIEKLSGTDNIVYYSYQWHEH